MRARVAVVGFQLVWLLAGCREPMPEPPAARADSPAVSRPAAAEPDPAEPAEPATPGGWTVRDTQVSAPSGVVVLAAVRTARHEGYDRIVFEFDGDTLPGFRLSYVDKPQHQCGSGEEVWLAGDAWLSIRLEPAHAHTEAGAPTVAERARRPQLPNLLELRMTCDFEAQVEWVAGVASPAGYRIQRLQKPARLVVDLRQP